MEDEETRGQIFRCVTCQNAFSAYVIIKLDLTTHLNYNYKLTYRYSFIKSLYEVDTFRKSPILSGVKVLSV